MVFAACVLVQRRRIAMPRRPAWWGWRRIRCASAPELCRLVGGNGLRFLVAGGVWLLPDQYAGAFFGEAGFWSGSAAEKLGRGSAGEWRCRRSSSRHGGAAAEKFCKGAAMVFGPALTALQWELAERSGGGLFQITLPRRRDSPIVLKSAAPR